MITEELPAYVKPVSQPIVFRWREAEEQPAELSPNGLVNLFKGNYSLKRAFWFYNLLLPIGLGIIDGTLMFLHARFPQVLFWTILFWGVRLTIMAYSVIALIGLWRSADRYHRNAVWKILAQGYVVLNALFMATGYTILMFQLFALMLKSYQ